MDYPRVRWIDAHPFVSEGEEMVLLNDVEGIVENSLIVSKDMFPYLAHGWFSFFTGHSG